MTEGSLPYTRTGYGILWIRAEILDPSGNILCTADKKLIEVDCCKKAANLRAPTVYWYGNLIGYCNTLDGLCAVPLSVTYAQLRNYSMQSPYNMGALLAMPEKDGSCPPYKWQFSGQGSLIVDDGKEHGYKRESYFVTSMNPDCHTPLSIKLTDRCGTIYDIVTGSVCDEFYTPLSISYTTLKLSCKAAETVNAAGGVAPYTWSLSGGGTIEVTADTIYCTYTAPNNNSYCLLNPTIQVTDCCGNTASIQLAINCYHIEYPAFRVFRWSDLGRDSGCGVGGEAPYPRCRVEIDYDQYDCDGNYVNSAGWYTPCICYDCGSEPSKPPFCEKGGEGAACNADPLGECFWTNDLYYPGQTIDLRDDARKAAACCPLNPETGKPF